MASQEMQVNALPTKSFFVEMFTKDISLDQAVLDLLDNSVDGAKRKPKKGALPLDGYRVDIEFGADKFVMRDNAGGFTKQVAIDYAFRFGKPKGASRDKSSIGRFGVGMKRALFKFGDFFKVSSATESETWAIAVDVPDWEDEDKPWTFPWAEFEPIGQISTKKNGTEIEVTNLHPSVSKVFESTYFEDQIRKLIRSKHQTFIGEGMEILVNGERIEQPELTVKFGERVKPSVWKQSYNYEGHKVSVQLIVGISRSAPREAGWYIICNGRLIRDADKREETGWGVVEDSSSKSVIPGFHNQYARFRGIAIFDSVDSTAIPWNTTKTDIDADHPVWRNVREEMISQMRPIVDFLNELDADIDDYTRERSPLYRLVEDEPSKSIYSISRIRHFEAPDREDLGEVVLYVKIQYPKEKEKVEQMKDILGVSSARAVGERAFDIVYKEST